MHKNFFTSANLNNLIKNYWLFFLTFISIIGIWVTHTNQFLFLTINAYHTIFPASFWELVNYISGPSSRILPILMIIIVALFRRDKILNVFLLIFAYFAVFDVLKNLVHEARPFMQLDAVSFYFLSPLPRASLMLNVDAYRSFPSGHTGNMTIFVFTLSYLFAQNKPWLRILLIFSLALVMISRICTGWHFPIDVLSAALIGFILTQICMTLNIPIKWKKQKSNK